MLGVAVGPAVALAHGPGREQAGGGGGEHVVVDQVGEGHEGHPDAPHLHHPRRAGGIAVGARPHGDEASALHPGEGLGQAGGPLVPGVVVGQGQHVEARLGEAIHEGGGGVEDLAVGALVAAGIYVGIMSVEGITGGAVVRAIVFGALGLIMFWGAIHRS